MKKLLIFLLLLSQIATAQNKVTLTGGTGAGGGVQEVSVTPGNGFNGSVLNSTSTPAITISTNQTGLLNGNGTSVTGTKLGNGFFLANDSLFLYRKANIIDYGAIGDGTTNNNTAIQAAINTGYPVFIPSGTYLVSTTMALQTNQIMYGEGWNSVIKITANTRAIGVDSGSVVRDLRFVGNGKAGSGTFNAGVFLNTAVGFLVDHCMFQDFAGDVGQNGGGGVYGASIHTSNSDGGFITNCYFWNNDVGLNLAQRAEYVTISNISAGANNVGICLGAGNITINGGVVQNNTIGLKAVNGTNVAHNTINGLLLNHNGIPLDIADATHLLGYTFNNLMVYYGYMKFTNCSNIKFSNCHFNFIDSVVLDNSAYLTRIGGWWGLNSSGNKISIRLYNGAEDFAVIGETRYHADSVNNWIKQVHADTISFVGPLYATLTADVGNKSVRYNTSTRRFSYADTTTGGGGGGFGSTTLSGAVTITGAANSIAWNAIPSNIFNDGTTNRIGYTGTNSYINSPNGFNNVTSDNTRTTIEGPLRLTDLAGNGTGTIAIDNNGDVTFSAGGGGANTALSNLASVAINTSLISDANNTDDLGSSSLAWKDIYSHTLQLRSSGGGLISLIPSSSASNTTLFVPTSGGRLVNRSEAGDASTATPTPTGDAAFNFYKLTALATNATFAAPSGTWSDNNLLTIRILDNGTTRTLAWNAAYDEGSDIPLPTATIAGEMIVLGFQYITETGKFILTGRSGGY